MITGPHAPTPEESEDLWRPDDEPFGGYSPGGYVAGSGEHVPVLYQHDQPKGPPDHLIRPDGMCAVCGVQVFDVDKTLAVLNKININIDPDLIRDAVWEDIEGDE